MDNNSILSKSILIKFARAEQPIFEDKKSKGIVEFGLRNDYPDYIMGLFNESPKHGAIVKSKVNYIYGKGFKNGSVIANSTGETWNHIAKKCIQDDELYGGYYLQIVYNLNGDVKDVFHLEFHRVRCNKEISEFQVKNLWCDTKEKPRKYNAFNIANAKEDRTQVLFVKQYNPKSEVYPLPSYFHGLNYIDADVQVSRHILGNAKDGFVASTLINLNNGEPNEEQKAMVEKGLKKKFSGSEGDRVAIMFNKSKDNSAEIIPLGNTMLTKEDFTNINNLIQQEVFACHQVVSPMLFGIKTEGQLGGRGEIRDAYEIFNNTYVNERQMAHEESFGKLMKLAKVQGEAKIMPVEPLGFLLKDELLLEVLPLEYFQDKMSLDDKYRSLPVVKDANTIKSIPTPVDPSGATQMEVNKNLAGMTGKQFQQLERIIRKYKKGTMNRAQTELMLKSSFGLSDEDIIVMLDDNSSDFKFATQEEIDFALIEQFEKVGEDRGAFEIIYSKPAREHEYFTDKLKLDQLDSNVLDLIRKDKRITPEVISQTLGQDISVVNAVILSLVKNGKLSEKSYSIGDDKIIERIETKIPANMPKSNVSELLLRYSYEGPEDDRNRPFCAKLLKLNKLYSRADIETISERLGYSVWDRRGGWFTQPNGEHRPYCRHSWMAVTVTRKK